MERKILVCGDVRGNFRLLFTRVEKLNRKKGPFEFLLTVGDFFGSSASNWEPYKSGALKVPIPTYVLGPTVDDHLAYFGGSNGCELCANVYYLGKRGILASGGLRIAYASGKEGAESEETRITRKDVQELRDFALRGADRSEYLGVDVLLTSQWPKNVTDLDGNADEEARKAAEEGSSLIAWTAAQLRPRYHFAGLRNVFYERPPYRNHPQNAFARCHSTRFIALASLAGKKWMYGAVLVPIERIKKEELYLRTSDETESPYPPQTSSSPTARQFFFDEAAGEGHPSRRKRKMDKISQEKCWFCLAGGQDLDTVVHIGEEAYVALPKGGLGPRHLIVCPVKHLESDLHLPGAVRKELDRLKSVIAEFHRRAGQATVFFERHYRTSHMQVNAVPVPEALSPRLRPAFLRHAENSCLRVVDIPPEESLRNVLRLEDQYLHVELPDGSRFYIRCEDNFPIYFARKVLASKEILNASDKVEWKACLLPEEEEQEQAKRLRKEFAEHHAVP